MIGEIQLAYHFPQLFVKGTLITGCDIVMEMDNKGELGDVLQTTGT